MTYQTFAHVYDEVMDHSVYKEWLFFTKDSIRQFAQRPIHRLMELACGTGEVATLLSDEGYEVTGVDLSTEMLSIAKEKYAHSHPSIQWTQGDMRSLEGVDWFDAVTVYSDSLCYLTEFEDVEAVFQTVYDHLEEGGVFLFDVHSLYQMEEVFPGYQYNYVSDSLAFLWQSYEYDEPGSVEHVIDMFVKTESTDERELFEHFQEVHVEQTFPIEMYTMALEEAGFTTVAVKGDFGRRDVQEDTPRWFFIAVK